MELSKNDNFHPPPKPNFFGQSFISAEWEIHPNKAKKCPGDWGYFTPGCTKFFKVRETPALFTTCPCFEMLLACF